MDTDAAIKIRTRGKTVDGIIELNLSSMNLKHLDAQAFEKMKFLESLDVSSNRLTSIPQLPISNLKTLYCELNMFNNVLFLKHFPSLEEVFLTGNPLSLSDRFIAVAILPKLRKLDNKDCSKLREVEHMLEQRLRPQITKVWEMHFSEKLHSDLSATQLIAIQKQFVSHLKRVPLLRLEVPSEFKKFKVEEMATEFFNKIVEEVRNANRPMTRRSLSPENVPRQPRSPPKSSKVHQSPQKESTFNQRDFSQENPLQRSPQRSSPRKSIVPSDALDEIILNSAIRVSPRKHKLTEPCLQNGSTGTGSIDYIQQQTSLETHSPRNASLRGQNAQENRSSSKNSLDVLTENSPSASDTSISSPHKKGRPSSPSKRVSLSSHCKNLFGSSNARIEQCLEENDSKIAPYSPKMFLRCHSRDNDPSDCGTQVWCAAFEPDLLQSGKTTAIVATCGGTNICLIDCTTGHVMKRYKHSDPDEDFYCLAWTVVRMEKSDSSLIAAAGLKREVILFHPSQLVSYHTFKAHSRDINCLAFHKKKSTWLFTGSSDRTICLWDIGIPSCPEYKTVCKRLAVFDAELQVLQLGISLTNDLLVGACDGALFAWSLNNMPVDNGKKKPQFQLQLPESENKETATVDGLCMLSDTHFAVKVACSGQIHICSLVECLKSVRKGNARMKSVPLIIVATLEWSSCKTAYLYLRASEDARILTCGDDSGGVWIYDVHKFIENDPRAEGPSRDTKYKPDQMLSWPSIDCDNDKLEVPEGSKISVNAVALSSDGNYLMACTDKNLACIWTTCISN